MAQVSLKDIKAEGLKLVERINEKNPYYLVIGALIALLLLDYFLIMQFQLSAMRQLGPKILEVKNNVEMFEENSTRIDKYKKDIQDLDVKLAGLQDRIKTTEEIPGVLEELSRIANRNKVFIEQILPETSFDEPILENEEGKYFLLPILVDAKSGYHDLGRFLDDLETEGALMRLDHLSIESNSGNPRKHLVKLMILAVVFEPKN